ncbi:MAG: MMPL family transporter [Pseudomonadota bacterium]
MRKLAEWVLKFRWLNIIITIGLIAFFGWKMTTAVILNDPDDWSNQKHPYVKLNHRILKEFGGATILQVMVKVKEGGKYKDIYNTDTLKRVKEISDRLYIMKGFIPPNFEGLAAPKVKYFKATEEMITIEQMMAETPRTDEAVARIKEGVLTNPLVYGKLVSKDFKGTLIMADYNREITLDEIYEEALKIKKEYSDENHTVEIAGKPVQMGWLNEQQRKEMPIAFLFLFLVLGTILYISFQNKRGVILPLLVGIIGSVIGMGAVAWTGVPFNIISYGSPFIILAAGAAHVVQYLKRYQEIYGEIRNENEAIIQANVHIMPPLIVSVVTDSLGFVIILFTPFSNLINMAVGSAVGLISFLYLVIFFVPSLTSLFPPPSEKAVALAKGEEESFLGRLLGKAAALGFGPWRWRLFIPGLALGIIATISLFKFMYVGGFDWDTAIYSNVLYRWKTIWVFQDQNDIAKTFSGAYPYNILIEGKEIDVGKDPEFLHQIERMQDWLESRPEITYSISLPNYLRGINILFHEGNMEYNKVADDPLLNAQYLFMLSTGSPGEFETTVDTVTWKNAALKTLVSCGNPRCYDKLVQDTHKWVKENWTYEKADPLVAGGFIGVSASMSEDAQAWLWPVCVVLVFLIYLICAILFRHLIIPIFLVAPLLYVMVIMLGLLQYLTMSGKDVIDYNAQQFISLCLGVGIDANVYLLFRYFEELKRVGNMSKAMENAWTSTGKAVMYSALSLSLAYIPLICVKTFWGYLGLGSFEILILNMLGSLFVLPIILGVFKPKFLYEGVIKK